MPAKILRMIVVAAATGWRLLPCVRRVFAGVISHLHREVRIYAAYSWNQLLSWSKSFV